MHGTTCALCRTRSLVPRTVENHGVMGNQNTTCIHRPVGQSQNVKVEMLFKIFGGFDGTGLWAIWEAVILKCERLILPRKHISDAKCCSDGLQPTCDGNHLIASLLLDHMFPCFFRLSASRRLHHFVSRGPHTPSKDSAQIEPAWDVRRRGHESTLTPLEGQ